MRGYSYTKRIMLKKLHKNVFKIELLFTILVCLDSFFASNCYWCNYNQKVQANAKPFRIMDHKKSQKVKKDQRSMAVFLKKIDKFRISPLALRVRQCTCSKRKKQQISDKLFITWVCASTSDWARCFTTAKTLSPALWILPAGIRSSVSYYTGKHGIQHS